MTAYLSQTQVPLYRELRLLSLQTDQASFHMRYKDALKLDEAFFWDEMYDPTLCCLGEFVEDKLVGMLILKALDQNLVQLYSLYVRPEFRRQGIAGKLLKMAKLEAKKHGMRKLRLTVISGMSAEKIYLEQGFVKTGTVPGKNSENILEFEVQ
jgi:ribosomal protein S18 acetylase RimI-like enzyme